ncbi:hypothetical protein [Methylococcus sp. EFPC2]|uniref:hypothetical protein n=1 Tax=Methylococcus sp. EFPC2 TaxID=2812648 RepID=UPI001967298F|nr:hypothetical protein [Methylococcus sp. EFPC2]QSA95627.1 hypothetical protein JWZ97_10210 [Methylococcus sp. EFPC2]
MKAPYKFQLRKALTGTALIAGGLSVLHVEAAPRIEFQGLGTLGGATSSARGLNDHGQIVGSSRIGDGPDVHAFLYSDGAMQDLGTLGGFDSVATGINNRGQIVGHSQFIRIAETSSHGFIYSNGVMRDVGLLDRVKGFSAANAINDEGVVAGHAAQLGPITNTTISRAIVLSNGSMTDIGALGGVNSGRESSANAINASGQIVGVSENGGIETRTREAFIYSGGVMRSLGLLGGTFSEATAINDGGEIAGNVMVTRIPDVRHAFRYVNGTMRDLGTLGGPSSAANAINNSGQIVGHADITGTPLPQRLDPVKEGQHATLWNGNVIHDLNTLAPTGWTLTDAAAINRYAQIVGTGKNQDHPEGEAFLLTLHPDWQGNGNGNWDDGSRWNFAGLGSFSMAPGARHDVVINPDGNATINGGANASIRNLNISGNAGKLVTFNLNGGSTNSMQGTTLNHATLAGNGTLEGGLTIAADSRVDVAGGDRMQLRSGQVNNDGLIRILGSGGNRAALEADGLVINAGGGEINLENAALSLLGGLDNRGQVKVSFGASSISGDLTTVKDGKIILSGSSETTFWDSVTMQSGSELRLAADASAVFFGQVIVRNSAMLTGTGTSFYEGGLSLGNSPGMASNAGSVSFGLDNFYLAEIGGLSPGEQFDQLQVGGKLSFGGTLKLMWWDHFSAKAGDVFDLFDWGNSAGRFASIDTGDALLADGLRWDFSRLYTTGEIGVAAVPLPGAAWLFIGGLLTVLGFNRNAKAGNPI